MNKDYRITIGSDGLWQPQSLKSSGIWEIHGRYEHLDDAVKKLKEVMYGDIQEEE